MYQVYICSTDTVSVVAEPEASTQLIKKPTIAHDLEPVLSASHCQPISLKTILVSLAAEHKFQQCK